MRIILSGQRESSRLSPRRRSTRSRTGTRGRVVLVATSLRPSIPDQERSSTPVRPSLRSGRRESNPLYMTPSHAYYHYTTARFHKSSSILSSRRESNPVFTASGAAAVPRTTGLAFFYRGAGNRTRSTRTRSVRTTGILHPEKRTRAPTRTYDRYTTAR